MFLRFVSLFFLAFALTGAPFGMGRMMASHGAMAAEAHSMSVMGNGSGHHAKSAAVAGETGKSSPAPKQSGPQFAVCAASAAACVEAVQPVWLITLTGLMTIGRIGSLSGFELLPPTPPPRA